MLERLHIRLSTAALGGLAVVAAPATASAADGEQTKLDLADTAAKAGEQAAGSGGMLVRTIVGLAIVLAVIWGITWVLRQVKASREDRGSGAGLKPIATLPLGPNRALHLIRAGSEVVLVGAGEHGVVPVRTYTEAEARELGLLVDEDDEDAAGGPGARRGGGTLIPRPRKDWLEELRARTVIK